MLVAVRYIAKSCKNVVLSCIYRYTKNLASAKDFGIRKGVFAGAGMGFFFLVIFASYALAFWYGGKLIRDEGYTAGRMLIVSTFNTVYHYYAVLARGSH